MKKSELINKLIEIEKESKEDAKITMSFLHYLKMKKLLLEIGDIEI